MTVTGASAGVVLPAVAASPQAGRTSKPEAKEDVSAPEDLMREHGVLNRILLVYEEGVRRLRGKTDVSRDAFHASATLVRQFLEDYHERLEEKYLFVEFEKRGRLMDLIKVLRDQHAAGRRLTDAILRAASPGSFGTEAGRGELIAACESFIRMYRPHEAREDTVLFPALRALLTAKRVDELGEQFEQEEHRLFGQGGFEKTVEKVAAIERQLGIHELAQFTPR
jgi:hemerythrin-like domain-containing protein